MPQSNSGLRGLALVLVLLITPWPAMAQQGEGIGGAQQAAIRQVIESQFAAFRRDDGVDAFSYASPGIRTRFGTAETFMHMVRQGYPAVYRSRGAEFLGVRIKDGRPVQAVRLIGPDGRAVVALYEMEQQPDGSWKIAGVYLLPLDDRTS